MGEERQGANIYFSYTTAVCRCAINRTHIKVAVLLLIPGLRPPIPTICVSALKMAFLFCIQTEVVVDLAETEALLCIGPGYHNDVILLYDTDVIAGRVMLKFHSGCLRFSSISMSSESIRGQ